MDYEVTLDKEILSQNKIALARAITLTLEDEGFRQKVCELCLPYSSRALRIGIAGPPGAGKSSLIRELIGYFLEKEKKVAVLSNDPVDKRTGGAFLADRLEYQQYTSHKRFYARSIATNEEYDIHPVTPSIMALCAYAGYDVIIVESTGLGQRSLTLPEYCNIFIWVTTPFFGGPMQVIKTDWQLKPADIIVITRGDILFELCNYAAAVIERTLAEIKADKKAEVKVDVNNVKIVSVGLRDRKNLDEFFSILEEVIKKKFPGFYR